jgi:hypothetical protein
VAIERLGEERLISFDFVKSSLTVLGLAFIDSLNEEFARAFPLAVVVRHFRWQE